MTLSKPLRVSIVIALGLGLIAAVILVARPDPLQRARAAREQGRPQDAAMAYQRYLTRHPSQHEVRLEFAELLTKLSPTQALDELEQIPPTSSQYPEALRQYAGVALTLQRDDLALSALMALEQRGEQGFAIQLSLAEIAFRAGDYEEALRRAKHARDLQPQNASAHLLIADSLDKLGRHAEMVEPLRLALEQNPDLYNAHLNLAYAYRHAGRLEDAEREARWCLTRDESNLSAWLILAMIKRDQGDSQSALAVLQKALALAPQDIDARILEAQLLVSQNQPELAFERLKLLERQAPNNRQLLALLSRAAMLSGHADAAKQYRQRLAEQVEREINR